MWSIKTLHDFNCSLPPPQHIILLQAVTSLCSAETALLKIHNDIICNMDNGKVAALTLLDLSAAFDTIDN